MAERPEDNRAPASRAPATREEAVRLLADLAGTIAELEIVLEAETAHLAAGRVREGLALEAAKSAVAGRYLRGVEVARANVVALARFAPDEVAALRAGYDGFRSTVGRNQAVLATARAVSEGLVRGVAEDLARQSRPSGYGSPARARAPAMPLVLSTRL